MSKYRDDFFTQKRPWSVYKDLVLDYYMKPYLQKVKNLGKPIFVYDMFAGRGDFDSGEIGSPLILAKHLAPLHLTGIKVSLNCFEEHPPFHQHLQQLLRPYPFATARAQECFSCVDEIERATRQGTVFVYVDPMNALQLDHSKLERVYNGVRHGSVEILLVFMAQEFLREAARSQSLENELLASGVMDDPLVAGASTEEEKRLWLQAMYGDAAEQFAQAVDSERALSSMVGGGEWRAIIRSNCSWEEKCWQLIELYQTQMRKHFRMVGTFPIRKDEGTALPRYWLILGSRYEPALDLFNSGACEATRSQRQNYRKCDSLFAGVQRQPEQAPDSTVDRAVQQAFSDSHGMAWRLLRWRTYGGRHVGKFTEGEVNRSIKRLIKQGWLQGATGERNEEEATLTRGAAWRPIRN